MKLRLEDTDGQLITYADAPDDKMRLLPVEWNGDRYRPFGTLRQAHDDQVIANYRRYRPLSTGSLQSMGIPELPTCDACIHVNDPNTPRRQP